jgi:ABC-2 type transport system ATP-binding protein
MEPFAIDTQHLHKVYNGKPAVTDLSLQVERGEVFGFLGPNGAGKTTSVKMLLGLIRPTSGSAQVLGKPLGDNASRAHIGFLPEHFRFHDWLTAEEFLSLHGKLYHMPDDRLAKKIPHLLNLVNLSDQAGKKLRVFSKGMSQRIGLAQALLNDPDLVILDEPTSGLDPGGRRLVRDIIRDLREGGTTVFINSHFLSEVEITCDRVAFIKNGRVIHTSSLVSLVEGEITLDVKVHNLNQITVDTIAPLVREIKVKEDSISMILDDEALLPVINRILVEGGSDIFSYTPKKLSLEELFLKIVEDEGETKGSRLDH